MHHPVLKERRENEKTVTPLHKAAMPVAPKFPFHKVTCTSCGWSHISVQRSDVILAPDVCGQCGGEKLKHSKPGIVESMRAQPVAFARFLLISKG